MYWNIQVEHVISERQGQKIKLAFKELANKKIKNDCKLQDMFQKYEQLQIHEFADKMTTYDEVHLYGQTCVERTFFGREK
jgi:hypothetical protein